MFLLDTNCWMQLVRDRAHAGDVRHLLAGVPLSRVFVSLFSVHSIGTVVARRGLIAGYSDFLSRTGIGADVQVVSLPVPELRRVEEACLTLGLDFDDGYQYVAAEVHGLRIVSLDPDFDRTPRGRLTPAAAMQRFADEQSQRQQKP